MIATGELDDLRPVRISTGNTDGRHDRFRTRIDEAYLIQRRDSVLQHAGKFNLKLGRRPVQGAVLCRPDDGLRHMRMGMSDNDRSVRGQVINVAIVVYIPKICALSALHENRGAAAHSFKRS